MSQQLHTDQSAHDDKVSLGFWIYLMTDCVLFASLFAAYAVLKSATNGGPGASELFDIWFVLGETILLLVSSLTAGMALLFAKIDKAKLSIALLVITGLLGAGFLFMELSEFSKLVAEGNSWQSSAFLSAFFTLVATHGLHITAGIIWLAVMIYRISTVGLTVRTLRKLSLFTTFWHFLDVIWIFIFTVVYMIGVL